MGPPASPIEIDKDGDLCLLLFEKERASDTKDDDTPDTINGKTRAPISLVVSSKVLCLASPVFKVMLTGNFREAREFRNATKQGQSERYVIELPEDDATATTTLMNLLHLNFGDVREDVTASQMEQLAYLCDKYQCAHVLKYCGKAWISTWKDRWKEEPVGVGMRATDICRMLVFAYVADLPSEFNALAWGLALTHRGPILGPEGAGRRVLLDHPLSHQNVARHIENRRLAVCKLFHKAIFEPLNTDWKTLDRGCFGAAKAIGKYLKWLRSIPISCHDANFQLYGFGTLFQLTELWVNEPLQTIRDMVPQCTSYRCDCEHDMRVINGKDLLQGLQQKMIPIRTEEKTFVCLDCLRSDGESKAEGSCTVPHSWEFETW